MKILMNGWWEEWWQHSPASIAVAVISYETRPEQWYRINLQWTVVSWMTEVVSLSETRAGVVNTWKQPQKKNTEIGIPILHTSSLLFDNRSHDWAIRFWVQPSGEIIAVYTGPRTGRSMSTNSRRTVDAQTSNDRIHSYMNGSSAAMIYAMDR